MLDQKKLKHIAPIYHFEAIGSTNTKAATLGIHGAKNFTCVVADAQTEGRGRHGKQWKTLENNSVALSLVVRHPFVETLPLITSLAVFRVLRSLGCPKARIKWPNDVLVEGKKVSGILVERVGSGDHRFYVVGIGLNVNTPEEGLPQGFVGATLSDLCGKRFDLHDVVQLILDTMRQTLETVEEQGWAAVAGSYAENCETIGKRILWQSPDGALEGLVQGINTDGALVLKTNDGIRMVYSGLIIE